MQQNVVAEFYSSGLVPFFFIWQLYYYVFDRRRCSILSSLSYSSHGLGRLLASKSPEWYLGFVVTLNLLVTVLKRDIPVVLNISYIYIYIYIYI